MPLGGRRMTLRVNAFMVSGLALTGLGIVLLALGAVS
jgi:hypothetical protein